MDVLSLLLEDDSSSIKNGTSSRTSSYHKKCFVVNDMNRTQNRRNAKLTSVVIVASCIVSLLLNERKILQQHCSFSTLRVEALERWCDRWNQTSMISNKESLQGNAISGKARVIVKPIPILPAVNNQIWVSSWFVSFPIGTFSNMLPWTAFPAYK